MEETVTGSPLRGYQRPVVGEDCGTTAQLDTVVQHNILFTYIQRLLKVFALYIYTKFVQICFVFLFITVRNFKQSNVIQSCETTTHYIFQGSELLFMDALDQCNH